MLVERFQVTEDPEKAFPSNADCFVVHEGSAGMGTTLSSSKVEGSSKIKNTIELSGVGCPEPAWQNGLPHDNGPGDEEVLIYSQLEGVVSAFVRSRMRGTSG